MEFEQEGDTTFLIGGIQRPFRYRVTTALWQRPGRAVFEEELEIWLEDTETTQQWQTAAMRLYKDDYINANNTIPDTEPSDYAEYFAECLRCNLEGANYMFGRSLEEANQRGTRKLMLTLVASFTTNPVYFQYSFELFPVPLGQTNVLEARVRELVDANKRLKNELEGRSHTQGE